MNRGLPNALRRVDIPPPKTAYKQTNIFLRHKDLQSICDCEDFHSQATTSRDYKHIIIFVGGLMDSYHHVVFREFAQFVNGSYQKLAHIPFCAKIYTTFDSKALFYACLPTLINAGYYPYIFAHSWGAANITKVLATLHLAPQSIPLLVTMDPVGYWRLKEKPQSIQKWVNIYIADKWQHITPPNICTYFGHAWNHCISADREIAVQNYHISTKSAKNQKIITHASIRTMLHYFNTSTEFSL